MLTTLALQVLALAPLPAAAPAAVPATCEAAVTPAGDVATAVSIKTQDDLLLKASYYAPRKKKGKAPAALLLHDEGGTREDLDAFATYLHKRGFAVLTIDIRGHGESATDDFDHEKADEKGRENLWNLAGRDVEAAAEYLAEQDGVHNTNLSVVGFGAAASLAVRRANTDENVRAVVLVEPELETYGYDLGDGVADLGGLPTMVVTTKDAEEKAEAIQTEAQDRNGGLEFVETIVFKGESKDLIGDKKTQGRTSGWLRDQAMPRK